MRTKQLIIISNVRKHFVLLFNIRYNNAIWNFILIQHFEEQMLQLILKYYGATSRSVIDIIVVTRFKFQMNIDVINGIGNFHARHDIISFRLVDFKNTK